MNDASGLTVIEVFADVVCPFARVRRVQPGHVPGVVAAGALALTHAAYRRSLEAGEGAALRLRQLTFDEGVDVSRPEVIDQVIDELDLPIPNISDDDSVTKDWDEGRQRGVVGWPHFFTPDGGALFCPTLDRHKEGGLLAVHFDEDAFAQLTAICFR